MLNSVFDASMADSGGTVEDRIVPGDEDVIPNIMSVSLNLQVINWLK